METLNFLSVRQRVTYNYAAVQNKEKSATSQLVLQLAIELVAHILTTQGVVMTSCYRISGRRQRKIH
jgi:hypothetical protein